MGQTYTVILKTKIKDKEGAKNALLNRIAKGEKDHTNYSLDHYKEIGITTNSIEELLKIIFGGWNGELKDTGKSLKSDFDACYGWEWVMMTAFEDIAPFLSNGSRITIYPDSGKDVGVVNKGKVNWIN